MTIAEQIRFCFPHTCPKSEFIYNLLDVCAELGKVTQNWENESTEFDFADGSLLIVTGSEVKTYKSR